MRSLPFLTLSVALFVCNGLARADVYGFVNGDRVSVIISDTQPDDPRYTLFKKGSLGKFVLDATAEPQVESAPAVSISGPYSDHILAAAKETKVDPALIHAVITVESSFNPAARSVKGAVGLMQLMPDTAKRYGVKDRLDPAQNIQGGARYLRDLMAMFNDNLQLVLAAYNAGEEAVVKYGRKIPPYRETLAYVPRVLHNYKKLRATLGS
jgi:soluble lytic murein transglycosylase-like protein